MCTVLFKTWIVGQKTDVDTCFVFSLFSIDLLSFLTIVIAGSLNFLSILVCLDNYVVRHHYSRNKTKERNVEEGVGWISVF